jgi:hypothetical protein
MARFAANSDGEIIQFLATYQQEQGPNGPPPPNAAFLKQFDETTNAGIVSAYQGNSQSFSMVGGTVAQSGTPVNFNPDGIAYSGFLNYAAFVSKLKNSQDPITRQEFAEAFGLLFRDVGRAV